MSNKHLFDTDIISFQNLNRIPIEFEYDPNKSKANKAKHGIDFKEAQALWLDRDLVVVKLSYPQEKRYVATGRMRGKPWSAIFTVRGKALRIIYVRRAHKEEERRYEEYRGRRARSEI